MKYYYADEITRSIIIICSYGVLTTTALLLLLTKI